MRTMADRQAAPIGRATPATLALCLLPHNSRTCVRQPC